MSDEIGIYNHDTGLNEIREMTTEEKAAREKEVSDWLAAKAASQAEADAIAAAKLDAVDKLTALGIDPKALGL